jgi:hypothetical protein
MSSPIRARDRRRPADGERTRGATAGSRAPDARARTAPEAASLLALQRTAGNQATAEVVAGAPGHETADDAGHSFDPVYRDAVRSGAVAQRTPAETAPPLPVQRQDAPAAPAAAGEWTQQRNEMEDVRGRATARQFKAEACVGLAAEVLTSVKTRLEGVCTVYGTAYDNYSRVVAAGKAAAKSEEEWIDIGVGILMAVGIATGVGAAGMALEVGEGLAVEATKEAIVSTATELTKHEIKQHTGLLEVVGTELEPGGLKPAVMKLKLWEQLVHLHAKVLATVKQADLQSLIASGAEYAIGEIKAQVGGGAGADLDVPTLHTLIGTLAADDGQSGNLDKGLSDAIDALQGIKASLSTAPSPYGREVQMEKDIWILWMAELSEDEAKVLDIDAIEVHLENLGLITSYYGSGGLLGVDTGIFTTKNDCLKMIEAAKAQATALEDKYGSIAG